MESMPPPPFVDRSGSAGESSNGPTGGIQSSYAAQNASEGAGEDLFEKFGMDKPVDRKSSTSNRSRPPPPLPPSASSLRGEEKIKPSYSTASSHKLRETSTMDSGGEEDDEEDERAAVEGQILQERDAGNNTSKGKQKKKASAAEEGEGDESTSAAKAKKVASAGSDVFAYDKETLGTTALPIARVQRIIKADQEMENTSKEAVFLIAAAAELFIKHLSDLSYTQAKLDKNRKVVHYRDVQRAVQKDWTLEFLQELVPPSMPLSAALAKRQTKLEENLKIEAGVMDGEDIREEGEEGGDDEDADEGDAKDGGKPKKVKHSGKTWLQNFVQKQQGAAKKAQESMEEDGAEGQAKGSKKDEEPAEDEDEAEDNGDETDDDLPDVASAVRQTHEENAKKHANATHKASNGRSKVNHRTVAPDSDSDMHDA